MRFISVFRFLHGINRYVYLFSLTLLAVSLPVSLFLISVAELLMVLNWFTGLITDGVIENNIWKKIRLLWRRKGILLIFSIYLIHVIGLVYTSDFNYAVHDLRIKLPLLALPIIIGTMESLNPKELKIILQFFIISVIIASFLSILALLGAFEREITDVRYISLFISHIRFSLLINIAIFIMIYYWIYYEKKPKSYEQVIYPAGIIWLVVFLIILQSLTGIFVLLVISIILLLNWSFKQKNKMIHIAILAVILLIISFGINYLNNSYTKFYSIHAINVNNLEDTTINGNRYFHDINNMEMENGNYVWLYVCHYEMRKEWNGISDYKYDSLDKRGQNMQFTLMRYLTSLGYRKDSVGISKLLPEDIQMIEKGYSNHIFKNQFTLYPRLYQIIWEIDNYRRTGNPSGHSITQRLEYLKAAFHIIRNKFWQGTGTGDVEISYKEYYDSVKSPLSEVWRLRAHNQFITFFLTFGIFGFLWIIFALTAPLFIEKKQNNFLAIVFFLIGIISMLNEDTLETHVGVSFFAFFYSLFIFGIEKIRNE